MAIKTLEEKLNMNMKRHNILSNHANELLYEGGTASVLERRENIKNNIINSAFTSRAGSRKRILAERTRVDKILTKQLFVESMFKIFYDALLLDEDFKETYRGNLYNLVESNIEGLMEENNFTIKDLKRNTSGAVEEIIALCEEASKATVELRLPITDNIKISKTEIMNEATAKTINDGIKGDFDNKKKFVSGNISEIVKTKVANVISDEKKKSQEENQYYDDINEKVQRKTESNVGMITGNGQDHDNPTVDPNDLQDGYSGSGNAINKPLNDDGTDNNGTFDSTDDDSTDDSMGDTSYDAEGNAIPEDADTPDDNTLDEDVKFIYQIGGRKKVLNENSFFKNIMISISNKNIKEMRSELNESGVNSDIELDMNLVFAEAISYYTLLETLHTTKILNITPSELRKLSNSLYFSK